MKRILIIALALLSLSGFAQEPYLSEKDVSSATRDHREFRLRISEPIWGLQKVKNLIAHLKRDESDNQRMSTAEYDSLIPREKFTYAMLHGEDMNQNCNGMPWVRDEEKKIFGYLPGGMFDDQAWSDRQRKFLQQNRVKVIGWIRTTMHKDRLVGLNLKHAILEVRGYELIPDLKEMYRQDRRDKDILTMFFLFMKDAKYKPFLATPTYKKLYSDTASYQAYLSASPANERLTLNRITAFYKSR